MNQTTISSISRLAPEEKREIYSRIIPPELRLRFGLNPDFIDAEGRDLLQISCPPGSTSAEMELRHQADFPDPILYGHVTDTINGQIHVLLYVLNDPDSPRFDVDRLPDGTPTKFGTQYRNLEAEQAALEAGLAPGQIRKGLRMLGPAIVAFENFVSSLGHDLYFIEPLYYHSAVTFEQYGFSYEKGRRLMEQVHAGFSLGGELLRKLDPASPFRRPEAANSVRLRSWAIHDGILDAPFTGLVMYKRIGKTSGTLTCPGCGW